MTLFSYGFRPEAIDPPSIDQRLARFRPLSEVKPTLNVRFQGPMKFSAGNVCFRG